jgi:hypothetical protein
MEDAELFFKAIFWIMVAPFWLGWKLLVLIWEFILKPRIERYNREDAVRQASRERQGTKQKSRDETCVKQPQALKAAVPSGPPERMRATIQINEEKQARMGYRRIPRLIGEDNFISVQVGEDLRYSVDMILEMSETERAIIKEHELYDIELEETPLYTAEELRAFEEQYNNQTEATKGILLKEIRKQTSPLAMMKEEKLKTRVGDLLVVPFSRSFDSRHEAKTYADKLKTKFLPEIRKLLDDYAVHKRTEILEF